MNWCLFSIFIPLKALEPEADKSVLKLAARKILSTAPRLRFESISLQL